MTGNPQQAFVLLWIFTVLCRHVILSAVLHKCFDDFPHVSVNLVAFDREKNLLSKDSDLLLPSICREDEGAVGKAYGQHSGCYGGMISLKS